MAHIYVASSWRNKEQPKIVADLRADGHKVYDFRNPPNATGFHWREVMPEFNETTWTASTDAYLTGLKRLRTIEGFNEDYTAMRACDTCVLVLPCGASAHLELGWFAGKGKRTAVLLPPGGIVTPELMYLLVDYIAPTRWELVDWLHGV